MQTIETETAGGLPNHLDHPNRTRDDAPVQNDEPRRRTGLFLASDPAMQRIKALAERVAKSDAAVLVTGESGVGKEVLARYIHARSNRARSSFVKINCAAVPRELLESELFGHEKGAFTGAHQRKEGKFELAAGGTIFLDEIGEMDLSLQAKLLHVLEDSSITRIGGTRAVPLNARVVATTNRNLEDCVQRGEFRMDLYFRLNVIRIHVPPLRERPQDIPLLSDFFLRKYADRQDSSVTRIPERLEKAFVDYRWPGNVRELKHLIQRYVILPDVEMVLSELAPGLGSGGGLTGAALPPALDSFPSPAGTAVNGSQNGHQAIDLVNRRGRIPLKSIAAQAAEDAERRIILEVLRQTRWNRKEAAARLDICYKTLLNKLERWDLDALR